nr:transcriptional regulator, SARP family [Kibdelosporangium sp. MJ126-NF4]CTQ97015.1 transcriptional regulator, SARP family [Kibdelosporangium sp. MJ126-NF4]
MAGRFGTLLRQLRLDAELTQQELGERSGVSVRAIRRLETGSRGDPRVATVRLLADALCLSPDMREELLAAAAGTTPAVGVSEPTSPVPRQLPAQAEVFVGRGDELALLNEAFDAAEPGGMVVVSAVGGGGIGKTWLALRWAQHNVDRFPDGQLFVDLRGFAPGGKPMEPTEAVRGFLDALGVNPSVIPVDLASQTGLYRSLVAGRRMLIVLDNAADTDHVLPLLPGSPTCAVIVTSRDRLVGLVTTRGARAVPVDALADTDARDLLARRLGQRRLAAEPAAVDELLACCAGLPLALAVVAARAALQPGIPLAALAAELRDTSTRLGALDTGDPAANVHAALSWTLAALQPAHVQAFALIGLAPGPHFGLLAAASLTGLSSDQTRTALRALNRVSLLHQRTLDRYQPHDLVRLHAAEHARDSLPEDVRLAALRRLVDFYLHTAYSAERLLEPHRDPIPLGPPVDGCQPQPLDEEDAALAWLDIEYPNLLAAQRLAVQQGWHAHIWQLAWTMDTFHLRRGHRPHHLTAWRAGVAAAEASGDPHATVLAYRCVGRVSGRAGLHGEAMTYLRKGLAVAEQIGDIPAQAHIHTTISWSWDQEGDLVQALAHATHALPLFRRSGDSVKEAWALNGVGWLHGRLGHHDQARVSCQAALELYRRHGDRHGEGFTLDSLGYIAQEADRHTEALAYFHQALALRNNLGSTLVADTLDRMAKTLLALHQPERARNAWQQAFELYQAHNRPTDAERIQCRLDALDQQPDDV